MKFIRNTIRLCYINYILAKNGLDQVLVSMKIFAPFRFIVLLNPFNWFRKTKLTQGEAIRLILEQLGPVFVKFGQALSTRPDILPPNIALELRKLQNDVPPFSGDIALEILHKTFGISAYELFAQFDKQPLASASIAQVHAATLKTGEEVVVKILRPGIEKIIVNDVNLLYLIANLLDKYWSESIRVKPKEIVQEFERSLLDELNLQKEAANASQLKRNFSGSPHLYVPAVYWDYITENVLVMERIYGIPITDMDTLRQYDINIVKLAERGIDIFFTQVFRDCFFHADMHPGNIFVSYNNPDNPQYICVDFGIIGTLTDKDKRYLAENLLAFFNRDYKKVAQLHIESGWVAPDTSVSEFEALIRTVCEPIFERPLKDISFGLVVTKLFRIARRFNMQMQPQLVLLQKTLVAVEGLGRQLYPDLDLWQNAKPFLEKWVKEQMGPKAFIHSLKNNWPFFVEQLPDLPKLAFDVLELKKSQLNNDLVVPKNIQRKSVFSKGVALGMFISFTVVAAVMYSGVITQEQTIIAATIIAGLSALSVIVANFKSDKTIHRINVVNRQ